MPLRLSERTSSSSALSTISRFVFSRVSLRAWCRSFSSISMLVLPTRKPTPFSSAARAGANIAAFAACRCSRVALALHSREDAKLAEEQHVEVDDFVVAHQMGVAGIQGGAGAVAFDAHDDVFLVFEPTGVLDGD